MMGMVEELEKAQLGVSYRTVGVGLYVCGQNCAGGRLGDGAADYAGGGSSICDEVEDEVQH